MEWRDFDFKAVSLFTKFTDRAKTVYDEFNRVGISSVIPFWGAFTPYNNILEKYVKRSECCRSGYFYVTIQHQQMLRVAYDTGARNALFFEDDVRFLKSVDAVNAIVGALPDDYDVALFDWILSFNALSGEGESPSTIREQRLAGKPWARFSGVDVRSTAAYAVSRKGMERYLEYIESPADCTTELDICDAYWGRLSRDCTAYCATKCACIQGVDGGQTPYRMMLDLYGRSENAIREEYGD